MVLNYSRSRPPAEYKKNNLHFLVSSCTLPAPFGIILSMVIREKITYKDKPGERGVDLRPFGIDCIPYVGSSRFQQRRRGTVYHVHPGCVEICLCMKGRLLFESDGACFPFLPGSVFVSYPNQPHRMQANPKGLTVASLLFKIPRSGARILDLPAQESAFLVRSLTGFRKRIFQASARVKREFVRVFEIYDSGHPNRASNRLMMRTAVLELLLALIESAKSTQPTEHSIFSDIAKRMSADPRTDYPLAELAREADLSKFAFSEAFKRVVGLPPHAWLIECRVRAAQKFLRTTRQPVKDIALSTGFYSSQHLTTAFKLSTGISPIQYRRHIRRKLAAISARSTA